MLSFFQQGLVKFEKQKTHCFACPRVEVSLSNSASTLCVFLIPQRGPVKIEKYKNALLLTQGLKFIYLAVHPLSLWICHSLMGSTEVQTHNWALPTTSLTSLTMLTTCWYVFLSLVGSNNIPTAQTHQQHLHVAIKFHKIVHPTSSWVFLHLEGSNNALESKTRHFLA